MLSSPSYHAAASFGWHIGDWSCYIAWQIECWQSQSDSL